MQCVMCVLLKPLNQLDTRLLMQRQEQRFAARTTRMGQFRALWLLPLLHSSCSCGMGNVICNQAAAACRMRAYDGGSAGDVAPLFLTAAGGAR